MLSVGQNGGELIQACQHNTIRGMRTSRTLLADAVAVTAAFAELPVSSSFAVLPPLTADFHRWHMK
jgi:hypothetical protein